MINIQDVWYEYSHYQEESAAALRSPFYAVQGVNLTVREGEFLCVVGHNGSGKSTLAKMMNALLKPTRGTISVLGMDASNDDNAMAIRRNVGLILQNPDNQLVTTVVEEDVAFGPENLGVEPREIRERVDEALRMVGLSDKAKAAPHMLSGGQKQRVAIAGVLAMRPRVMVMDEPTAMLDPEGRREVISTSHRLCVETGLTVVLITHFMNEALGADRVAIMESGKITREGAPREVLGDEEALLSAGLMPPRARKLATRLRQRGIVLPEGILDSKELVEGLCAYKQRA